MKKILIITNIPSPYRIDFFNELGKNVDLTVLYEAKGAEGIRFNWNLDMVKNFKPIFLSDENIKENKINFKILNYIKKGCYDEVFATSYSYFTEMLALIYMKLLKIPYNLEIDGGLIRQENKIKKSFKMFLIKGAKKYFSPSASSDKYLMHYGAKKENITRYPFTSLAEKEILQKPLGFLEKSNLRTELGIKEEKVIISIGQFINRKGFDILLNACKDISNEVGVYIIGGKATDEYLQIIREHNLSNIHFIEFQTKEMINRYLQASDIFVLPTREDIWGLVINEAMAQGLPVITTDKCVAGLELVENDINGYIVPINDTDIISEKINHIIYDVEKLLTMAQGSLEKIREYTIENMARVHVSENE